MVKILLNHAPIFHIKTLTVISGQKHLHLSRYLNYTDRLKGGIMPQREIIQKAYGSAIFDEESIYEITKS